MVKSELFKTAIAVKLLEVLSYCPFTKFLLVRKEEPVKSKISVLCATLVITSNFEVNKGCPAPHPTLNMSGFVPCIMADNLSS